ncbi:hypothetical protein RRG08_050411 [Elysia crispata]|uniref:Uncharacterized protein n=1 Tax=Elysia crispata TaxID=231223 RepID=A0AAE1DIS7_9GAST|nr:hypothetical protein RRG08_050411 [Elysia crispata]
MRAARVAGTSSSSSTSSSSLPRKGQASSSLSVAAAAALPGQASSSSSSSAEPTATATATKLGDPPLVLAPVSQQHLRLIPSESCTTQNNKDWSSVKFGSAIFPSPVRSISDGSKLTPILCANNEPKFAANDWD